MREIGVEEPELARIAGTGVRGKGQMAKAELEPTVGGTLGPPVPGGAAESSPLVERPLVVRGRARPLSWGLQGQHRWILARQSVHRWDLPRAHIGSG